MKIKVMIIGFFLMVLMASTVMAESWDLELAKSVDACISTVNRYFDKEGEDFDAFIIFNKDGSFVVKSIGTKRDRFRFEKCLAFKGVKLEKF